MARGPSKKPRAGSSKQRDTRPPRKQSTAQEELLESRGDVDDFFFKRDQIFLEGRDEAQNGDEGGESLYNGEAVLDLGVRDEDDDMSPDEDDLLAEPSSSTSSKRKRGKLAQVTDTTPRGRFAKPILPDEEDEEDEGSSGSEGETAAWGRQYYSRPSTRRAAETGAEMDEEREEEREMEEKEVIRLQKLARGQLNAGDWGLEDIEVPDDSAAVDADEPPAPSIPLPTTDDPAALMRHMETNDPVKLALSREYSFVVDKLRKTSKGIKKMMAESQDQESLHKGLGWLHYQTLLTYTTTLAYYFHLAALPSSERPDLGAHPVMQRLLQLKEGLAMLEDLDFAAGSESEIDPIAASALVEDEDDEEEVTELKRVKKDLIGRMLEASGSGVEVVGEDDSDEDDLWQKEGLEDGELEDLLKDADPLLLPLAGPSAKTKNSKRRGHEEKEMVTGTKKKKAPKAVVTSKPFTNGVSYAPLEEPDFNTLRSSAARNVANDNPYDDPTSLEQNDDADKQQRKRSLQFHTAKISATSARRQAARAQRFGGDDDLPQRNKQAARDAALRRSTQSSDLGEAPMDGSDDEMPRSTKKRRNGTEDDYYSLVKRQKDEEKAEAMAAKEAIGRPGAFEDETHGGGPRALSRAIEKNRGLTPRRNKTARNPRVKKRAAYKKAQQKVGSQRAVFKGGQASLRGAYSGEKSGISSAVKSRRF